MCFFLAATTLIQPFSMQEGVTAAAVLLGFIGGNVGWGMMSDKVWIPMSLDVTH